MIIRCPNQSCNTKMSLHNRLFKNENANVKCPSCKQFFKPYHSISEEERNKIIEQENQRDEQASEKIEPKVEKKALGWLVVHDEKTHSQTYDLYQGKQIIGKKSENRPCDIMIISQDPYLSRNHFSMEVLKIGEKVNYLLKDNSSANGTFIEINIDASNLKNLRRLKEGEEIYIEDGAIIQAGDTKIILKSLNSSQNKSNATESVQNQDIPKTVIL